jgi:hypothetical protein
MHGANWSTKPLDRRLADSLAVWRADCRWVRRHLRREGVETIGDWRANPFVRSMDRMAGALEAIAAHVPDGDCFILVGGGLRSGESAVAGRRTMLLDRSASTPTGALPAVERRRMQGASFLAVAWPAFEWLAADGLRAALADRYTCTEETEDVVVFGLTP